MKSVVTRDGGQFVLMCLGCRNYNLFENRSEFCHRNFKRILCRAIAIAITLSIILCRCLFVKCIVYGPYISSNSAPKVELNLHVVTVYLTYSVCQNIFVSKFANSLRSSKVWSYEVRKFKNRFVNEVFDWLLAIHGPIRGYAYRPACEFQYWTFELLNEFCELLNDVRNIGKRFAKSTV
jgi:hypothetical protein